MVVGGRAGERGAPRELAGTCAGMRGLQGWGLAPVQGLFRGACNTYLCIFRGFGSGRSPPCTVQAAHPASPPSMWRGLWEGAEEPRARPGCRAPYGRDEPRRTCNHLLIGSWLLVALLFVTCSCPCHLLLARV